MTANVLNLYSNTMSARVADVKLTRWQLAVVGGILGLVFALLGYQKFAQNYQNFLVALDYWIMPWLAIILLDFYYLRHRSPVEFSQAPGWNPAGPIAPRHRARDLDSVYGRAVLYWTVRVMVRRGRLRLFHRLSCRRRGLPGPQSA